MDLDLKEEFERLTRTIRPCTMCNIPPPAYPIISGSHGARVMSVGQCPGLVECEKGMPFAGPAGKNLFAWLASTGIAEDAFRARAYMTSVTKCLPAPDKMGRREAPRPIELHNCAKYLVQELRVVRPEVIIAMGVMATGRLLGDVKLDDVVGRAFPRRYHGFDTLVIPLPHPSGRSAWINLPGHKSLLDRALGLIKRRAAPLVA